LPPREIERAMSVLGFAAGGPDRATLAALMAAFPDR
jgi:hypothetical protein